MLYHATPARSVTHKPIKSNMNAALQGCELFTGCTVPFSPVFVTTAPRHGLCLEFSVRSSVCLDCRHTWVSTSVFPHNPQLGLVILKLRRSYSGRGLGLTLPREYLHSRKHKWPTERCLPAGRTGLFSAEVLLAAQQKGKYQ